MRARVGAQAAPAAGDRVAPLRGVHAPRRRHHGGLATRQETPRKD